MKYRFSLLLIVVLLISCTVDHHNKVPDSVEFEDLTFKNDKGYYNDHLYTGIVIVKHPSGEKKYESTFIKGVDSGEFFQWDEDGNLVEKANSKQGKLHGKYLRFYSNGQKHFETMYYEGIPEGEALEWHENGQIKIKYYYKDGKENGLYTLWNEQGVRVLEGQMKNGERHGEWYEFNSRQGKVIINTYDYGELLKSKPES